MTEPTLTEREALEALNQLRSNVVATQSASWSNVAYPLVAILDAAGFHLNEVVTDEQVAEHFDTYGGAGGYPGHPKRRPSDQQIVLARNVLRAQRELREKMRGD